MFNYTNIISQIIEILAIISSILVISSTNAVVSVLYLVVVFVCVSIYLIIIGITFVGISYIIVYVGAITVLVLFVIIILNIRLAEMTSIGSNYTKNIPIATVIGFSLYYVTMSLSTVGTHYTRTSVLDVILGVMNNTVENTTTTINININKAYIDSIPDMSISTENVSQVQILAIQLYNVNPIWLIFISIILLIAIVGPIVLSKND